MGKSKKKIDTANSVKNSPPEPIEKVPESVTPCDTHEVTTTSSESRILDHEDFVRMSRRH